jgi:hypothetical protein
MIKLKEVLFEGYDSLEISSPDMTLWATVSAGPRILGLSAYGSDNLMAVLPGAKIGYPGDEDFLLIGGHRLWYGPEDPERTYIPDTHPVAWNAIPNGVEMIQEVDAPTGIQKQLQVELHEDPVRVTIKHILINQGAEPYELAPWAITQLKLGGVGIMPLSNENSDPYGLHPNRDLVFWPYTEIGSESLKFTNQAVYVKARMDGGALKIGSANRNGWLAYFYEDLLFIKHAEYIPGGNYIDRGASSQIYCNPNFIELETLSPLVRLLPGENTSHMEEWKVFNRGEWPEDMSRLHNVYQENEY